MLSITDLKVGAAVTLEGSPYVVVKAQHSKMGRGGAVMRTTLKNLVTGNNMERTFHGDDKIEAADLSRHKAQYLYRDGTGYLFMDLTTFDQFTLDSDLVGFASNFLVEGQEVDLQTFEDRPINISLPTKMTFKVTESEPAIKGDTANNPSKNATIETGLAIRVPMFVQTGDSVIVDTRDGSYVERAK